jgi:hypothetical protein
MALIVVVGWCTGVTELTTLSSGQGSMKFNTAVGLVLAGFSIVALVCGDKSPVRRLGRVAAGGFGLIGLATLCEYTSGRSFGFDNPFGFDHALPAPGRIATTSAVCFLVVAIAVLALDGDRPRVGQLAASSSDWLCWRHGRAKAWWPSSPKTRLAASRYAGRSFPPSSVQPS